MAKVYIVTEDDYDDGHLIVKVFLTREDAENFLVGKNKAFYGIEEHDVE